MDRSAPNPIPNSWREGGLVGGREGGDENSLRKSRGGVEISSLTIKTCLGALKKELC